MVFAAKQVVGPIAAGEVVTTAAAEQRIIAATRVHVDPLEIVKDRTGRCNAIDQIDRDIIGPIRILEPQRVITVAAVEFGR